MTATKPRRRAEKLQEAFWLTLIQRPTTWKQIQEICEGSALKTNFRFPHTEINRKDSDTVQLLVGFKFRSGSMIDPYGSIPGQVANELLGVAAELVELANRISEIPHVEIDDTGIAQTAA